MQTQTQTQTQAETAPVTAPASPISVTTVGAEGTPQTLAIPRSEVEVRALRMTRNELSDQLASVTSRRNSLSAELSSAPAGASQTGIEERIRLLDRRILQIENDIAATSKQLASAPAELITSSGGANQPTGDDFGEGVGLGVFLSFVFVGIVFVYRRYRNRKRRRTGIPADTVADASKLQRLEQGMEAIAIEIERISEGQRFVTKLLAESPRVAQPAVPERDG
jgi:hypothetical protein